MAPREIVYRRGREVVAVPVTIGNALTLGRPSVLFEANDIESHYDVSPDGQRFLMLRRPAQAAGGPGQVNIVLNWFEELRRLVPPR
jgi:hypothetical protein